MILISPFRATEIERRIQWENRIKRALTFKKDDDIEESENREPEDELEILPPTKDEESDEEEIEEELEDVESEEEGNEENEEEENGEEENEDKQETDLKQADTLTINDIQSDGIRSPEIFSQSFATIPASPPLPTQTLEPIVLQGSNPLEEIQTNQMVESQDSKSEEKDVDENIPEQLSLTEENIKLHIENTQPAEESENEEGESEEDESVDIPPSSKIETAQTLTTLPPKPKKKKSRAPKSEYPFFLPSISEIFSNLIKQQLTFAPA